METNTPIILGFIIDTQYSQFIMLFSILQSGIEFWSTTTNSGHNFTIQETIFKLMHFVPLRTSHSPMFKLRRVTYYIKYFISIPNVYMLKLSLVNKSLQTLQQSGLQEQ